MWNCRIHPPKKKWPGRFRQTGLAQKQAWPVFVHVSFYQIRAFLGGFWATASSTSPENKLLGCFAGFRPITNQAKSSKLGFAFQKPWKMKIVPKRSKLVWLKKNITVLLLSSSLVYILFKIKKHQAKPTLLSNSISCCCVSSWRSSWRCWFSNSRSVLLGPLWCPSERWMDMLRESFEGVWRQKISSYIDYIGIKKHLYKIHSIEMFSYFQVWASQKSMILKIYDIYEYLYWYDASRYQISLKMSSKSCVLQWWHC